MPWHHQILTGLLTLSQQGGGGEILCPLDYYCLPPMFLDLPTALHWEECMNLLRWPGTHILSTLATAHLRPFKLLIGKEKKSLFPIPVILYFDFCLQLGSVAGPVIQANGRLTFEDDLRSGGLLYFTTQ